MTWPHRTDPASYQVPQQTAGVVQGPSQTGPAFLLTGPINGLPR